MNEKTEQNHRSVSSIHSLNLWHSRTTWTIYPKTNTQFTSNFRGFEQTPFFI